MNKTCILIIGPTVVGKTSLSVSLAEYFSTSIISCDSRQCFKELSIGVAKPSAEELDKIPHFFINSHSIQEQMNAALFEEYALQKVNEIFQKKNIAVMVGGTGLYAKSFCQGMDEVPAINPLIRQKIITNYNNNGFEWLREQVKNEDKKFFISGEMMNPQRLMRALEVKLSTGKSILEFQTKNKKNRDFNIVKIGIELPRPQLYERINQRVDRMIADGLLDEVKQLQPYRNLNALQTVGYKEMFNHFDGEISLQEAIEEIKVNTRHYAKRQMTWFKKEEDVNWCPPDWAEMKDLVIRYFQKINL